MTTSECPAAELAANFGFTDPRVREDPPAVYADAMPDYVVDRDAVAFRALHGVHSVSSLPVTFTPRPADWFASVEV